MLIKNIIEDIKNAEENLEFTKKGWKPILKVHKDAKILIVGQAPGIITQEKENVFKDKSGERLRAWMDISEAEFYDTNDFAVLPLDFYYPGKAKTGDKPPRKDFAKKWHPKLVALMPKIQLIILTGSFAQKEYLDMTRKKNLTETVRAYKEYLPKYFPLVHPSPLNQRWEKKNPFFKEIVIPDLQTIVHNIISSE